MDVAVSGTGTARQLEEDANRVEYDNIVEEDNMMMSEPAGEDRDGVNRKEDATLDSKNLQ